MSLSTLRCLAPSVPQERTRRTRLVGWRRRWSPASYLHPPKEIVRDSPDEQSVLDGEQPREQRPFRVLGQNRHPLLRDDGPGIYFLDHEMHRHSRLFDSRLKCLLHGVKPTEIGQERSMYVQHSREALEEDRR